MRSALNLKKLKLSELKLLIVDDNQVRYNKIVDILKDHAYQVNALLLDDINSFEKQLATHWDLIIFGCAYDLKLEQAFLIIRNSHQPEVPVLLLRGEDYHPDQYSQYLTKGVFDILNLDFEASTYTMLVRALTFSRLIQTEKRLNEELEIMQQQTQDLVQESNKAIAVLEEGMHIEANEEYAKLFGFKSTDDIIGLPIIDVLQPKNIQQFKQNFKKIAQGQFDQTGLEITTSNPNALYKTFKLNYFAAEEGVQLIVDVVQGKGVALGDERIHPLSSAMKSIVRHIKNNPANFNALVNMSLKQCPDSVLTENWDLKQDYFKNVTKYLQDYSDVTVYKIDPLTYITLVQAESKIVLETQLMGLKSLQKPQLIQINEQTYPLQLRLGYQILDQEQYDDQQFSNLIGLAYDTALPEVQTQATDDLFSLDSLTSEVPTKRVMSLDVETELSLEPSQSDAIQPIPAVAEETLSSSDLSLDLDIAIEAKPQSEKTISPTVHEDLDLSLDLELLDTSTQEAKKPVDDLVLDLELVSSDATQQPESVVEKSVTDDLAIDLDDLKPATEEKSGGDDLDLAIEFTPTAVTTSESQAVTSQNLESDIHVAQNSTKQIEETKETEEKVTHTQATVKSENAKKDRLSPMLNNLQQNLQHGLVSLKFQQFYDKDDSHMFTYEVSSSFIYDNAWKDIVDMPELNDAPNLSVELDRWMVVEASKQLHNFVMQYPNSRIIVNLNQHALINPQFHELIGKLVKMIGGQQKEPLILQFSEKVISENVGLSQHYLTELKKRGAQIAIRDFGTLLLSKTILERIPVDMIVLHQDFNKMIADMDSAEELQQKINEFREIREVNVVLQHLDTMNAFANAWNVDARFIQSEYFQKKMDQLVMQVQ